MRSCFSSVFSFCCILSLFSLAATAQQYDLPMGSWSEMNAEPALNSLDSQFHTAVRPYRMEQVVPIADPQEGLPQYPYKTHDAWGKPQRTGPWKPRWNWLLNRHLATVEKKDFTLYVDPVFEGGLGRQLDPALNVFTNSRGARFVGTIGERFSFQTRFVETQAIFPDYINAFIKPNRVVQGMGRVKRYGDSGWDFQNSSGHVSYSPSKHFNVQFGNGKHFIGEGYRSLLLSDNAVNYPYLKLTTEVWKLQYTNLYAQFTEMSVPRDPERGFPRKWTAAHYLSMNIGKRINIGVFEAIIWENEDSTGHRGLDVQYLNPIIILRPSEFNIGSADNALLGLNGKYKVAEKHILYGQMVLDEFKASEFFGGNNWWGNKYGLQFGYKAFDFVGVENLRFQTEVNYVRPFTYSHWRAEQAYGHMNQPLAHPRGANFAESVTRVSYRKKRLYGHGKFNYIFYGDDQLENTGTDIFLSYRTRTANYGYELGEGIATDLYMLELQLGYLINPVYDMAFELGYTHRNLQVGRDPAEQYNIVYLAFKAGIGNRYYDF